MNDGGGDGACCGGIKVRTDTTIGDWQSSRKRFDEGH